MALCLLVLLFFSCGIGLEITSIAGEEEAPTALGVLKTTSRAVLLDGTQYESGILGPGALYEIWVPDQWDENGRKTVLYAHGYVNAAEDISLPDDLGAFAGYLLSENFAVIYSSFSENGWAVKDGSVRTRCPA